MPFYPSFPPKTVDAGGGKPAFLTKDAPDTKKAPCGRRGGADGAVSNGPPSRGKVASAGATALGQGACVHFGSNLEPIWNQSVSNLDPFWTHREGEVSLGKVSLVQSSGAQSSAGEASASRRGVPRPEALSTQRMLCFLGETPSRVGKLHAAMQLFAPNGGRVKGSALGMSSITGMRGPVNFRAGRKNPAGPHGAGGGLGQGQRRADAHGLEVLPATVSRVLSMFSAKMP